MTVPEPRGKLLPERAVLQLNHSTSAVVTLLETLAFLATAWAAAPSVRYFLRP